MISLKKYLDATEAGFAKADVPEHNNFLLGSAIDAYGSALMEMGNCSLNACPSLGNGLKHSLDALKVGLSPRMSGDALAKTDTSVREHLRTWGNDAARHNQQMTSEVKEMLLTMAGAAESVSARDQRCAGQMNEVTEQLKTIATLDDLTEIRASIQKSTAELKSSIDRMEEEGKAALSQLQEQVATYQTKLEKAEELASRDALTGLSSRLYVEGQLEKCLNSGDPFCVAVIDIDGFKKVNDEHGHLTGDDLLKQFGRELRSSCRSSDIIGRWGGDEFILLYNCDLQEAEAQIERVRKWICGNYEVEGKSGTIKLCVNASIGLAERVAGEKMKKLVARADAAMYEQKAASKSARQ